MGHFFLEKKQTLPMVNIWSEKCECESVRGLGLTDCKDAPETERAREAGTNHPAPNTHINKHKRTTCWQSYIDKLKVCHIQNIFFNFKRTLDTCFNKYCIYIYKSNYLTIILLLACRKARERYFYFYLINFTVYQLSQRFSQVIQ